jgi:hypothetical protein
MLARVIKPNAATAVLRQMTTTNIRMLDSRRHKSHGSSELQHGHGGGHDAHEVDHHGHHDQHQVIYERLWQHKATLDWLPKPEGNWQQINGKTQAYYNQLLVGGSIAFVLAMLYLRYSIAARAGALTQPPYHLIGKEDFPGSKYDDAAGAKEN